METTQHIENERQMLYKLERTTRNNFTKNAETEVLKTTRSKSEAFALLEREQLTWEEETSHDAEEYADSFKHVNESSTLIERTYSTQLVITTVRFMHIYNITTTPALDRPEPAKHAPKTKLGLKRQWNPTPTNLF